MKLWKVQTLELGQVEWNRRRMIANASGNGVVRVPVQGWLLSNGTQKVLIDTGFRSPDVLQKLGDSANGIATQSNRVNEQLQGLGLEMREIDYIIHTHLHLDHAGQTDLFPMSTVVVVNRQISIKARSFFLLSRFMYLISKVIFNFLRSCLNKPDALLAHFFEQ